MLVSWYVLSRSILYKTEDYRHYRWISPEGGWNIIIFNQDVLLSVIFDLD